MRLIKELPDPFVMKDGKRVTTVEDWNQRPAKELNACLFCQSGIKCISGYNFASQWASI